MKRSTKAYSLAIAGYILTLLAYSILTALLASALGIPSILTGILNFLIVFAFCVSPWYHEYLDWLEEQALKYLPKGKDA